MKRLLGLVLAGTFLGGCVVHERIDYDPGVTPVTRDAAVSMSRAGYPESTIVEIIQVNGVASRPAPDDLVLMKQEGVADSVLNAMLEAPVTEYRAPRERRTVVREYDPDLVFGLGALAGYVVGTAHAHHVHHIHTKHCRH